MAFHKNPNNYLLMSAVSNDKIIVVQAIELKVLYHELILKFDNDRKHNTI